MHIDVRIPWEPGKRLGFAINRAMDTVRDWVLILDHDVFLSLNPNWYEICQNAIEKVGHGAGWITCTTTNIGNPSQKAAFNIDPNDFPYMPNFGTTDIDMHFKLAQDIYRANKGKVVDITELSKKRKLSGFFILTHKTAYEKVKKNYGLPDDKFLGWDNYYADRLMNCGYKLYIMKDLYVWHGYRRLWKNPSWGKGIVGR